MSTLEAPADPAHVDVEHEGLVVRGLSAGYGHVPVVNGVDLSVRPGEIVALLGRNGAGKTTLLMAIAGFLSGTTGEVRVAGQRVRGPAYRRARGALGLVVEGRSVFPSLTTSQNLKLARVSPRDACSLFNELEPKLGVRAGLLSGGEQQMLSLARALCRRPRVLLIDEISFGLAPIVCGRLFERLVEHARREGTAVLLVEQHIHYAAQVADRALIMNQGSIALEMPVSELAEREAEIEQLYLGGPQSEHHPNGAQP